MSLKDIGKYSDIIKGIKSLDKSLDIGDMAQSVASLIDGLEDIGDINKIFKHAGVSKEVAEEALKYTSVANTLGDTVKGATEGAEAVTNLKAATKGLASSADEVTGLGTAFAGLGVKISAILPILGAVAAAGIAAYGIYKYQNRFNDSLEQASKSQESYSETTTELKQLQTEFDVTGSKIDELESKPSLTLTEKSELNQLKLQNAELQRQINLKQKLANKQSDEAVDDAMDTLNLKATEDLTDYKDVQHLSGEIDRQYKKTDLVTATENEVNTLQDLQKQKEDLLNERNKEGTSKKRKNEIDTEIEYLDNSINKYQGAISKNMESLNTLRNNFIDESTNKVKTNLSEQEREMYNSMTKVIDDYVNNNPFLKQQDKLDKIFENDSFANAQQRIMDMFRTGQDLSVKDITNQFPELVAECDKAGISVESLREHLMALASTDTGMTKIESDFADFQKNAVNMINSVDAINGVLASNVSGKGLGISIDESGELSGEIIAIQEAFSGLDGYDPSVLFEKTANGVHLNVKAFRALQAEQEALEKKKYGEQQLALQQKINAAIKEQEKAKADYGIDSQEYTSAGIVVGELQNQLEVVNQLSAAYDGTTSAYQKWINAQSSGEEGDMFRTVSDTMQERGAELYKEGRYNTNEFRAIAQYYSNEDLSNASMEQVVAAYEKASGKIKRYFTGDKTGIDNFVRDMKKISDEENLGWVEEINENGVEKLKFSGSDEEIAERFGLSKEAIQALYRAMGEYTGNIVLGDNISTEQLNAKLAEATAKAEKAKETLSQLQDSGELKTDIKLDVDVSELDEAGIDERIASLKKLQEETGEKFGVDSSELEFVNQLLAEAELRKQQLSQETFANVSVDINGEGDLSTLGDKLQNLPKNEQSNVSINVQNEGQLDGVVEQVKSIPDDTPVHLSFSVQNEEQATSLKQKLDALSQESGKSIDYEVNVVDNTGDSLNKDTSGGTKTITVNEVEGTKVKVEDETKTVTVNEIPGLNLNGLNSDKDTTKTVTVNEVPGTRVDVSDTTKTVTVNEVEGTKVNGTVGNKSATVNFTKNSAAVDGYKPANKNAKVTFTKDSSIPDNYKPANKSAVVNYTLGTTPSYNPSNLTRTLTYNIKTNGSISPANGTAHTIGTANRMVSTGKSYATGNWGLRQDEKGALINEIAPEIIVRDGRSFIVNNGYPTFTNLKRGDIIFNGKQSKALLEHGYITGSHAKLAYEGGAAFSSGTWQLGNTGSGNLKKPKPFTSKKPSSTSKKTSTKPKTTSKAKTKSSAEKAEKATEEVLDWIKTLLERVARQTEIAVDAIDNAIGLANKQTATANAISKVQAEIAKNQEAKNAYMNKANSVGLSSDYVNKIKNGSLNIETITDENLKKKIDDYTKWLAFQPHNLFNCGKIPTILSCYNVTGNGKRECGTSL